MPKEKLATELDVIAGNILTTAIGMALIKKGLLTTNDIIDQLTEISDGIVFGTPGSELLKLDLQAMIKNVSAWNAGELE